MFEPGTSGSAWVMALQSHGFKHLFRVAESTHFLSAVEWLRSQAGLGDLRVAWRAADL